MLSTSCDADQTTRQHCVWKSVLPATLDDEHVSPQHGQGWHVSRPRGIGPSGLLGSVQERPIRLHHDGRSERHQHHLAPATYPADLRLSDVCPTACGAVDVGSCAPCAATDTCTEPPSYVVGTRGTTCEEEGLLPLADQWQCLNAHLQTGAPRRAQVCRHTRAERHPSVVPAGSLDGYFQELGVSNYPSGCYHWARAGAGWRVVQMLTLK